MYIFSAVLFSELFYCLTEDKESPVPLFILGRGAIRRGSFTDQFTEQIVGIHFNFLVQFFVVAPTKSTSDDVFLDPLAVLVYKFLMNFFIMYTYLLVLQWQDPSGLDHDGRSDES